MLSNLKMPPLSTVQIIRFSVIIKPESRHEQECLLWILNRQAKIFLCKTRICLLWCCGKFQVLYGVVQWCIQKGFGYRLAGMESQIIIPICWKTKNLKKTSMNSFPIMSNIISSYMIIHFSIMNKPHPWHPYIFATGNNSLKIKK